MIGRTLADRYEVLEELGGGGMSIVFKGRDTLLNRLVTIKVLRPEYTADAEFVARFRREAQAVASLSHPNIVSIYDVGRDREVHFLVMEFVDGENLKTTIKRLGLLPPAQAVRIAVQICEALEHAHENNIVHRDVKPHNILITRPGRAKLSDFGIAGEISANTVVDSGTVLGSVHYLSPEQARGEVAGPKSDIYSLGVVLYEMLAGALPFREDTPAGVALKHIQEDPPPITAVNQRISTRLSDVVARAMQKDPGARYASAREMALDLDASGQEPAVGEETLIIREDLRPAEGRTVRRWARPAAWAVLLLIVVGLVAGAGYYLRNYFNVPEVRVPNVIGQAAGGASLLLAGVHLQVETVTGYNPTVPQGLVISQDPVAGVLVKKGRTVTLTVSRGPETVRVPDLTGMTSVAAGTALRQAGLKMQTQPRSSDKVPDGEVITETPPTGSSISLGDQVTVVISSGPLVNQAVPDLTGLPLGQAEQELVSLNLLFDQAHTAYVTSTRYLEGYVVSQSPPANADVPSDTAVAVTVSSGPGPAPRSATVTVPVPADGQSHLFLITVKDARGVTDDYCDTEPSGAFVSRMVHYYGPAVISVYIDGNLAWQKNFPGNAAGGGN